MHYLVTLFTPLNAPSFATLSESVGPVGTPFWVPLTIALLMLFIFGWALVQRSWQTTVADQEEIEMNIEAARHSVAIKPEETAGQVKSDTFEPEPNDLKQIEGIGPKIESILNEAGIKTFVQLAAADVSTLDQLVREDAGLKLAHPDSWPEQAALAADGREDELAELQERLKGGRDS